MSIIREFFNSADRVIRMQASGADGLTLALGVVNVAGSLVSGRAAVFARTAAAAKVLSNNSRASGAMARLISAEARFAAGAGDVARIQKLVQLANAGFAAKLAVGVVLDFVGDREDTVEHLNNVLDNAENDQEVLEELATFPNEMQREDARLALRALGTPYDDQAPAASVPSAGAFIRLIRPSLRGLKDGKIALAASQRTVKAKALTSLIKGYWPRTQREIYDGLNEIRAKLGNSPEGVQLPDGVQLTRGNLGRIVSDLAHPSLNKRNGALYALKQVREAVRAAVPTPSSVTFEVPLEIASATGRRPFARSVDAIIDGVWHEMKNWRGWDRFPPRAPWTLLPFSREWRESINRYRALRDAEKQFLTALLHPSQGPNAVNNLRFVFSAGEDGASRFAPQIREHFLRVLQRKWLKKHMVRVENGVENPADAARYRGTIRDVANAIDDIILYR